MTAAVRAFLVPEESAETVLRNALSVVAAEGGDLSAIVVLVRPGFMPQLFWSSIDQQCASMAATRVQMFAQDVMRERIEEASD